MVALSLPEYKKGEIPMSGKQKVINPYGDDNQQRFDEFRTDKDRHAYPNEVSAFLMGLLMDGGDFQKGEEWLRYRDETHSTSEMQKSFKPGLFNAIKFGDK